MDKVFKGKVVVGLSGGVDSSVCALLLKNAGYEVIGLHMKNADEGNESDDAKMINFLADKLGINCEIVDYDSQMQKVKDYFANEYKSGRTPNPCVMCNKWVKFNPFIQFAEKIGADYYATGHYVRIERDDGKIVLKKAVDESKDQSYFLNQLSQEQLTKALFPLGELTKTEVKKIAEENGLIMANRKESYDVCFLGNGKLGDYLKSVIPEVEGNIVDINSKQVVGKHTGLAKYTLGQRKGLGIGGGHGDSNDCWFVTGKDLKTNTLYVSQKEDDLLSNILIATNFNWIGGRPNQDEFACKAKCRYRQVDQDANVYINDDGSVKLIFDTPQRAITTGQYAVLYKGDELLGGGVIQH